MSGHDRHPAGAGLCLWDTCSGCGDNNRFDRGYDPSHLCIDCDEALTLLREARPVPVATVTELPVARALWLRRVRPRKRA